MSRWLKNVNALLENLDNQVEETVEEHRFNRTLSEAAVRAEGKDGEGGVEEYLQEEAQGVDDILAKRGLLDEEGSYAKGETAGDGGADVGDGGEDVDATANEIDESFLTATGEVGETEDEAPASGLGRGESVVSEEFDFDTVRAKDEEGGEPKKDLFVEGGSAPTEGSVVPTETAPSSATPSETQAPDEKAAPAIAEKPQQKAPSSSGLSAAPKSNPSAAANASNLKELRKLRRHVLQLNSDLESAEREMEAQRAELDRAASRMERDRSRHKQEKESTDASHKAEVAALAAAHERAIQQLKESNESALSEMEERVNRAEQQRAQEGGERDIELASALERERASLTSAASLQEEKTTMNERIASLSTEISRLETRLEHASSQMDLASERERNAEEQLDKALTVHARQLGIRQKRESELEQTVADLGAAFVVAKGKVEAAMRAGINLDGNVGRGGINKEDDSLDLKAQLQDAQDEVETLRAGLGLERQRCATLHDELQDLAKAQADELSGAHAKQRQYERKISDLTTQVAKLQSSLRHAAPSALGDDIEDSTEEYAGLQNSGDEKKETDHLRKQIKSLSEKVFEQQTKIDTGRGEISTLKNRVRNAQLRSETAEKSLEAANQRLLTMEGGLMSGMSSADEEMGRPRRRKGFRTTSKVESIRSALGLHPGRLPQGGWQEPVASLLDTFDNLAVDLGSHFRHYPMSRLAFMLYLLVLHMWAFFLLVYHAHAQGSGGDVHGPEALLRSYRHMEQVPRVVAAVASKKTP
ncbi:hypothetical protein ACHAXT_006353 [Thalassiosira profunda]